MHVLLIKLHLF